MKPRVIFGLGNPGDEYENTPHNIGAAAVRAWAEAAKLEFSSGAGPFVWTPVRRGARAVIPTTYMNVCGMAVSALMKLMELKADELLVVTDDVWLPLGRQRLRTSGSDGGHNGLKSVAEALGSSGYARLRLGVGPVPNGEDWADFVLRKHPQDVQDIVNESITHAVEALNLVLARGCKAAQNTVNAYSELLDDDEKSEKKGGESESE